MDGNWCELQLANEKIDYYKSQLAEKEKTVERLEWLLETVIEDFDNLKMGIIKYDDPEIDHTYSLIIKELYKEKGKDLETKSE